MLARVRGKWTWVAAGLLLVLLILVPFVSALSPYTGLMIFIGIYTMVTVGLCLLMGYSGQVSLWQAAFFRNIIKTFLNLLIGGWELPVR